MPYPLLLAAGAVLSAAGTGASIAGQRAAADAMSDARKAELVRQQGYQQKADAVFANSLAKSGPQSVQPQVDKGQASRQADYAVLAGRSLGTPIPTTPAANTVVATPGQSSAMARERAAQVANNSAWNRLVGSAQAKMGGYADWNLAQNIKNNRAGQALGVIGSRARSSAAVLPYELDDASHAGDDLQGVGTGLQIAGSLVGVAGAMGMGPSIGSQPLAQSTSIAADMPVVPVNGAAAAPAGTTWAAGANPWAGVQWRNMVGVIP